MKLPLLLTLAAFLCAPLLAADSPAEKAKAEVIAADRAFCVKAGKDGVAAAFLAYCIDSTKFLGSKTLLGPPAAKALFSDTPKEATLTWDPAYAFASDSGDLAYTYGEWAYSQPVPGKAPATATGTYVTIWKRQADGSWKVALDGGTTDPKPKP